MNPTGSRFASAMAFALCFGLAFLPFGCAGEQDHTAAPSSSFGAPEAPLATKQAITACVERSAGRLSDKDYSGATFTVDVTPSGEARQVKLRESMISDHGLVSCIEHALGEMQVPRYILAGASKNRGKRSPDARAPMGIVVVLIGVAELVPILIQAMGVSFIVGVTIQIVTTAANDDDLEKMCMGLLHECLENQRQPKSNKHDFGPLKDCGACVRHCRNEGFWPEDKCPRP